MVSAGVVDDGEGLGDPDGAVVGDPDGEPEGEADGDGGIDGVASDGPGSIDGAVVGATVGTGPRPPEVVHAAVTRRRPDRAAVRSR
jgi:hypothetical protein